MFDIINGERVDANHMTFEEKYNQEISVAVAEKIEKLVQDVITTGDASNIDGGMQKELTDRHNRIMNIINCKESVDPCKNKYDIKIDTSGVIDVRKEGAVRRESIKKQDKIAFSGICLGVVGGAICAVATGCFIGSVAITVLSCFAGFFVTSIFCIVLFSALFK